MSLVPIEPAQADTPMLAHLRHDLANIVAPLPIIVELADESTAEVIQGVIDNYTRRLVELDILIDCPPPGPVRLDELAALPVGTESLSATVVLAPLIEWQTVLGQLSVTSVNVHDAEVRLVLECPTAWVQAAMAEEPGKPYCVRRVGTALAAAAAIVTRSGGRLEVDTDEGQLHAHLPVLT